MQTVQGVRAFSSSASAMNLVKAPVAVFGIEGRYATALYSAASKQKALDAVEKDLDAFSVQLKKDTRLREFILDPSIKKNLKVWVNYSLNGGQEFMSRILKTDSLECWGFYFLGRRRCRRLRQNEDEPFNEEHADRYDRQQQI